MNTFEKINIAILLATVSYIIAVNDLLSRMEGIEGWCQTNSNQSQFAAVCVNLCGTKLAPLGKCGGSVELEVVA